MTVNIIFAVLNAGCALLNVEVYPYLALFNAALFGLNAAVAVACWWEGA